MPRLSSDVGLSLEVSDRFLEVPELEVAPVCLVARVDPWDFPEQLQYLGIRGDRAVTICVQAGAGNLPDATQSLRLAVRSLRCDFEPTSPGWSPPASWARTGG